MKYPKRSQYKYAKSRYRIRNWPEYEAGLQMRGNLTVWLSDAALNAWPAPASGKPGGQLTYADIAIEAALTIRMVFHLPLRQTEGFLRSLAQLLELLIDSTGLRIHVGHLRKPHKNRAWRKLRLAVDASTGEIVASNTQQNHPPRDARQLPSDLTPTRGMGDLSSTPSHATTPPIDRGLSPRGKFSVLAPP